MAPGERGAATSPVPARQRGAAPAMNQPWCHRGSAIPAVRLSASAPPRRAGRVGAEFAQLFGRHRTGRARQGGTVRMAKRKPAFDPVRYKQATHEQWEAAAEAWHRWRWTLARWLGPATELMLDLARVGPGKRVLDVAAGAGDQTLATARRVGPSGYVLATDFSASIL